MFAHRALPISYVLNQYQLGLVGLLVGIGCLLALLPVKVAGFVVLSSIFLMLTLVTPKIALYLLIPAIPFSSVLQVSVGGAAVGPIEGLLTLMMAAWFLKMMSRQAIIIDHPPLLWPLLLFIGAISLSWLVTVSAKASFIETLKWLEMMALYLFISANFHKEERQRLVFMLLLAGLAQAGLGLYQFLFKAGPPGFLLFDGRFLRAYGTFRQPNPYAGYLGLVLPLALSLTLWGLGQLKNPRHVRRLYGLVTFLFPAVGFALLLAALYASQSRGAWLGFLVAAVLTVLLQGGRWALSLLTSLIAGAILISMGALALLPATITERFVAALPFIAVSDVANVTVTDANFAVVERLAHWQAAREMWLDHLWLGVGFGNYEVVYPAYAIGQWLDPLGHAHNYLLNIGAEAGLVGLLGYLFFWGWVFVLALIQLLKSKAGSLDRAVVAGCIGIFAHLHVHNLLDNLYVQGMYLHVMIIMSLITLSQQNLQKSPR